MRAERGYKILMFNPSTPRSSVKPAPVTLAAHRWDAKPWEVQEVVFFSARVERETAKAVLLVDATCMLRRSCWLPKSVLKGDRAGTMSAWAYGKLVEAGFGETDVVTLV